MAQVGGGAIIERLNRGAGGRRSPIPVVYALSRLGGLAGLLLLLPLGTALSLGDASRVELLGFGIPLAISMALVVASNLLARRSAVELTTPTEGFVCVVFGWTLFSWIGALPYWISGALPRFIDAWFEAMSGFTTTGASVLTSVEALSPGLHLWRALTQFIGGLGIIALFVAVLPALGAGGVVLFRSEVAAKVSDDRLRPRIMQTARVLWMIYVGLCLAQTVALALCGLSVFDALCHAMATVSTGGFSTRNLSFAAFSPAAQWVAIVFMFLGGTSFVLHGKALLGDVGAYLRSEEFRVYVGVLLFAIVALTAIVMVTAPPDTPDPRTTTLDPAAHNEQHFTVALRDAAFQATSIMTSTGFASADYDRWADPARFLLVLLMLVGGCAGSTAGGAKVFRLLLIFRAIRRHVVMLIHPSRVVTVRYDGGAVPSDVLLAASTLVLLFILLAVTGSFALMLLGVPFAEAVSGTVACLTCVGPALGDLGPTGNFSGLPDAAKGVLALLMLMGRLELYAVLVLLRMMRRE